MRTLIYLLAAIFTFTSCEKHANEIIPDFKYQGDKKASALIRAGNEFGIDLFKTILESEESEENIMISPTSVSIALGMAYNGAEGETKTAFENTLRLKGLSREEINDIYKSLIDYLVKADPKVVFEIANSVWYKQNFNILESFKDVNKNYFNAEVKDLDFNKPDAVKTINDWIALKTHDKIKDVLDYIPYDAVMYLINALYFNGIWKYEFEDKATYTGNFYGDDISQVAYMKNESSYRFTENDLFSAVELPYGNGNFVMYVFLPKEGKGVADIAGAMTPGNWNSWVGSFTLKNDLEVHLPKFKYEYKSLLNDPLTSMGLENAFTPGIADFSGITPDDELYISRVIHQTFIDVNEKGTEAAAVTVIEYRLVSMPDKTVFMVNKPFLYAITEKNSGALLFMGKVARPSY